MERPGRYWLHLRSYTQDWSLSSVTLGPQRGLGYKWRASQQRETIIPTPWRLFLDLRMSIRLALMVGINATYLIVLVVIMIMIMMTSESNIY